jgi:putative tryptophan/tyrosine transport system substrate-binding protein
MRRREFLGVPGSAAVAWPRAIHVQEAGCIYRLGIMKASQKIAASPILAFFDELRVFDFVDGPNLDVNGGGYGLRDEQPCIHRALTEEVICRRALE